MKAMKIRYSGEVTLSRSGIWDIVFKLAQENPELLRKVITIVKKNDGKVSCPFGDECVMFPCSKLSCHYDVLTNGVPGRGY